MRFSPMPPWQSQAWHTNPCLSCAVRLAADVYARDGTLAQHWQELQQRYGPFEFRSGYYIAQPPSKSAAVFERLRAAPPTTIGGLRVQAVRDLGTGMDTAQPGGRGH